MPRTIDFCQNWLFTRGEPKEAERRDVDENGWRPVHLPHTWNARDMAPGRPAEDAYIGPAWYRKHFELKIPDAEARYFLLFEAIANRSEVWVDGKLVGGREGGFLSFRVDITDALDDSDEHVVAVRADNSFQLGMVPPEIIDWERYGGIYRPVWLVSTGGACFVHKSTCVHTPEVSRETANVTVEYRVDEASHDTRQLRVRHQLLDPDGVEIDATVDDITTVRGRSVSSASSFSPISTPRLWSPESPELYHVQSRVLDGDRVLDEQTNPLGFRWFDFDPDHGFFLNGRGLTLRGANIHQDYPGLGNACPARFHRRDVELMKQAGMNYMRASHYPRNERVLDACDELGILVMEEQPFWHGSLRVHHGEQFVRNARRLMREMVSQHGNHPSIVVWNTVNEIMLVMQQGKWHPRPDQRGTKNQLHPDEWPFARRVLSAMVDELRGEDPDRPVSMVVGGNWRLNEEAGLPRLADIVAYNGGAFNSEVDGRPVYDLCKEENPERISVMSEGVLNDDPPMRADWKKEMVFWKTCARHWSRIEDRPWFCGGSMWVFADYSAKGQYRNMGAVDYSRLPYESFYFFASQWRTDLQAHILGHWNWPDAADKERRVTVFTNADEAELYLNGRSLGTRLPTDEKWPLLPHPPLEWDVPYETGELKVIARRGEETVEDTRFTSGEPHDLHAEAENDIIAADGRDVAFLTVTVADENGHRCYRDFRTVTVVVSGSADLAGPKTIRVRGGLGRFAVRSNGIAGPATVRIKSENLVSAKTRIVAE